ncbi:hypothetical protein [Polaromonas sp.]|uniref:hypothetical protein n=1 Tax=Polaromonas sp. TaxID=1869339 RepID=UPI0025EFAE25|nr:hypothetical protein [Polaromonas sp.]
MTEKTHYRKAFDSPYLSSADIVEPTILTVQRVSLESDKTKKTKDLFNTAHFVEKELRPGEKLKPMILNASNSKTMKHLTGSAFIDDWVNVPITVFVDKNVRFGKDTVEGLRIRSESPKRQLKPITDERLKQAIEAIKGGTYTAVQLEGRYSLTVAQQSTLDTALVAMAGGAMEEVHA